MFLVAGMAPQEVFSRVDGAITRSISSFDPLSPGRGGAHSREPDRCLYRAAGRYVAEHCKPRERRKYQTRNARDHEPLSGERAAELRDRIKVVVSGNFTAPV